MPKLDGTGPQGSGSMTGRGMGNCAGANSGCIRRGLGLGSRRGMGMGMGMGWSVAGLTSQEKKKL